MKEQAAKTKPYLYHRLRKPYFKLVEKGRPRTAAAGAPWIITDLCKAYDWPTSLAGGGKIAIVELGGGWVQSDMDQFFRSIGQEPPTITDISVDGTTNTPGQAVGSEDDPDVEVALDIQIAGAAYYAATGQPAQINVYWARDIAPAVRAAVMDGCDVCSISWGSDEAKWGKAQAEDMEEAAATATEAGMIVFAASGDNDSSDGGPTPANVDVPSSCPHVVGCGGTKKTPTSETVWNDDPHQTSGEGTGGGYSRIFPVQSWQVGAPHGRGRMVPDVAANADPVTGYRIVVHGQDEVVGGTSAVAPLYAGLFASFGMKLGFITPTLWANQTVFNDITQGENGAYRARTGPDACSGLGSPIAAKVAGRFTEASEDANTRAAAG
jgi:kumamolisin